MSSIRRRPDELQHHRRPLTLPLPIVAAAARSADAAAGAQQSRRNERRPRARTPGNDRVCALDRCLLWTVYTRRRRAAAAAAAAAPLRSRGARSRDSPAGAASDAIPPAAGSRRVAERRLGSSAARAFELPRPRPGGRRALMCRCREIARASPAVIIHSRSDRLPMSRRRPRRRPVSPPTRNSRRPPGPPVSPASAPVPARRSQSRRREMNVLDSLSRPHFAGLVTESQSCCGRCRPGPAGGQVCRVPAGFARGGTEGCLGTEAPSDSA